MAHPSLYQEEESDESLHNIFIEMGALATLLLCSEIARRCVLQKSPNSQKLNFTLWISSLVLCWYMVSVTLVLFNKWLLTRWAHKGINITVFYTLCHMVCKGVFATVYMLCRGTWPAIKDGKVFLSLTLAGVFVALDIVASNLSLVLISASFYTFLKSASLIFIFIGGIIAGIEEPSVSLFFPIALVVVGMMFATAGETAFNLAGFSLVMSSEVFAAMRWIIMQIVMHGEKNLDTMTSVLYMVPGSSLTLMPFAIATEREQVAYFLQNSAELKILLSCVLLPSALAFALIIVEVQLIKDTSGLTLTVFGNLKQAITILFCVAVFGDSTSGLQWLGLFIAIIGLIKYSHSRGEWQIDDLFQWREGNEDVSERQPLVKLDKTP